MDIKCRKTTCKHNDHFTCLAPEISVNKDTLCRTFENSGRPADDTSKKIFFEKVEYAPFRHCKNCEIDCKANCLFARKEKCFANGVVFNDLKNDPLCITHLEP